MQRKLEKQLLEWKNRGSNRMPLIINGARQVGKTYILRQFGRENFKNVAYVNLEVNLAVATYFEGDINPHKIVRYLEASLGERIIPNETLIILDEIQACERALTSLKYFCEEAPEYYIAAAGSLLGREHHSFPVGKVETLTLYPFDFEEYLWGRGKQLLCEEIRNSYVTMEPMPEALHRESIELFREYLVVGEVPACINAFLDNKSFIDLQSVQSETLNNYIADMVKYANTTESVRIRGCFNSIPAQLAKDNKKFQYKVV